MQYDENELKAFQQVYLFGPQYQQYGQQKCTCKQRSHAQSFGGVHHLGLFTLPRPLEQLCICWKLDLQTTMPLVRSTEEIGILLLNLSCKEFHLRKHEGTRWQLQEIHEFVHV